ncbi:RagB/SusD family nutrient uptake outer membrane protein [Pedobacter sp. NJ-S-72]
MAVPFRSCIKRGSSYRYTQSYFYYLYRKFVYEGASETLNRSYGPTDFPILRYADVLLMWAEALNELGSTGDAIAKVNEVRSRAGAVVLQMGNGSLPTYVSDQTNLRERIRNERRVEFPNEGVNYFDELRWKSWKDKVFYTGNGVKQIWGNTVYPYSFKGDYITTWPIPQVEIERNPNLKQKCRLDQLMKTYQIIVLLLLGTNLATAQEIKKGKLIFSDEFNYTGLPDSLKWTYEVGLVRNKEPQYYTSKRMENARVEDGNLVIEAKKEDYKGAKYTSASLITLGKKHFRYGRIEVKAKVPKGLGSWPAIWMLGENRQLVKWPNCGEIDILEYVGKDSTQVYGTVHRSYADCAKYHYIGEKPKVGAPHEDYHIYAIEWNKKSISFYYDDLKYFVFEYKKAAYDPGKIFKRPFYLLLNLALGREGTLGGPLDDHILPLKYYVDYVRVYK